ncbi:hypothetical protein CTEN210_13683 [Chaetoceros tenuissimus]|uniref:Leucine-rich repeat domain-containing protein n=1 Tax=Chaetoceros tenuissimus TaxID=426638 RepID=A0AAD3D3H0_9STRA|nr:hypothetical protein CTEN210_13683 [Chaetoceros tenuissimus]
MRVATVDGLVTLFYDGSEPLYNSDLHDEWFVKWNEHYRNDGNWEDWDLSDECKRYWGERQSWQQIIVINGVTEIPDVTFCYCFNIRCVIFADTVIRIEISAFYLCKSLVSVKWSINLEFIGEASFEYCDLSSVFIPPRCREIGEYAFCGNRNLEILNVPQNANLVEPQWIIRDTALYSKYPHQRAEVDVWLKNINNHDKFALHRVCASFEPTLDLVLNTMKEKGGLKAFKVENSIGITPSRYLNENPYAKVTEKEVIEKYVLQMMGEVSNTDEV